jgi:hypothetical protein
LALGVSGATAYLTTIRQTDDLRVVVGNGEPAVFLDDPSGNLTVDLPPQGLTFINAGNRQAAILDINLRIRDQSGAVAPLIYYAVDPFVIGPGQIIMKQILPGVVGHWNLENGRLQTTGRDFKVGDVVSACLIFTVATPDAIVTSVPLHIFNDELFKALEWKPPPAEVKPIMPPSELFKHEGTIFGINWLERSYGPSSNVCSP